MDTVSFQISIFNWLTIRANFFSDITTKTMNNFKETLNYKRLLFYNEISYE